MNFLTLDMVEIFEVGDVLNLGGSELIVAELRQGMAKIVPNTLYNRML
jgi:hypothetical protein